MKQQQAANLNGHLRNHEKKLNNTTAPIKLLYFTRSVSIFSIDKIPSSSFIFIKEKLNPGRTP